MSEVKINILGTEYTINELKRHWCKMLEENDGFCDDSSKEIVIVYLEPGADSKKNLEDVRKKILRHEIVHAFAFESGLAENSDWAQNEELVDWIAIQGPKIYKVWQEAGAL